MNKLPLYKILIRANVASRRKCNQAIKEARVKVNNKVITKPTFLVDIEKDTVNIDGKPITKRDFLKENFVYYILNKPAGYISTVKDTHHRKTVLDLIKDKRRIYPVGRLDKDTEGLLILTNDGQLTHRLTHPSFKIDKIYRLIIKPKIVKEDIERLNNGVIIDNYKEVSAKAKLIKDYKNQNKSELELIIHQGIKRQIKKMLSVLGYEVISLKRIGIGEIKLTNLKRGECRRLTEDELNYLKKKVGMS